MDILDQFGQVNGGTNDFSYKIIEKSIKDDLRSFSTSYHHFGAKVFFEGYEFWVDVLQIEDIKKFKTPEFRIY